MLCYKVDDYTKFIYPLKLHESLATGLRCVGAPIRTFREFPKVLDVASTVEEWSAALAAALTSSPRARSPSRRSGARGASPRSIGLVHTIATALGELLGPSYLQRVQQSPA